MRKQYNNDINKLYDIPNEYWELYDKLITDLCYPKTFDVVYKNQFRVLVDKHFGDKSLCYLSDNEGIPVKKSDLKVTYHGLKKLEWDLIKSPFI